MDNWPRSKNGKIINVGSWVSFTNEEHDYTGWGPIESISKDYSNLYNGGFMVCIGGNEIGNFDCIVEEE